MAQWHASHAPSSNFEICDRVEGPAHFRAVLAENVEHLLTKVVRARVQLVVASNEAVAVTWVVPPEVIE